MKKQQILLWVLPAVIVVIAFVLFLVFTGDDGLAPFTYDTF